MRKFKFLKVDLLTYGKYFFKKVSVEKNTVDLVFSNNCGIFSKCNGVG